MNAAKLTAKEEKFCLEVATGVDEFDKPISYAEAYRRAYNAGKMKSSTIDEKASLMMNKDKIRARVQELRDNVTKAAAIDASYVLRRLVEIDQMDLIDILNPDMSFKQIHEWPKVWRQYLSGFDLAEMFEYQNDEKVLAGIVKKIKWPDKVRNLELIGKHLQVGAFVERKSLDVTHHVVDDGTNEW